jgi:hypothetical protein
VDRFIVIFGGCGVSLLIGKLYPVWGGGGDTGILTAPKDRAIVPGFSVLFCNRYGLNGFPPSGT